MTVEEIKRDFDRDGYVVLRGFLSPEEVEELRAHAERCLSQVKRGEEYPGVAKNLNNVDRWFEDQLQRGKQTELISALLEDDLEPRRPAGSLGCPGRRPGSSLISMPSVTGGRAPRSGSPSTGRTGRTVVSTTRRARTGRTCRVASAFPASAPSPRGRSPSKSSRATPRFTAHSRCTGRKRTAAVVRGRRLRTSIGRLPRRSRWHELRKLEGNDDRGLVATDVFLRMNGWRLVVDDREAYTFLIGGLEAGTLDRDVLDEWLRASVTRLE